MNNEKDMPLGFAFQMAMNENALESFGSMSEEERQQILRRAKEVKTKEQMRGIVDDLGKMS